MTACSASFNMFGSINHVAHAEPNSSALQVEDKRLRAEQLDQASCGAAESALAPAVAGPGAGTGAQYVAAPAQCAHMT